MVSCVFFLTGGTGVAVKTVGFARLFELFAEKLMVFERCESEPTFRAETQARDATFATLYVEKKGDLITDCRNFQIEPFFVQDVLKSSRENRAAARRVQDMDAFIPSVSRDKGASYLKIDFSYNPGVIPNQDMMSGILADSVAFADATQLPFSMLTKVLTSSFETQGVIAAPPNLGTVPGFETHGVLAVKYHGDFFSPRHVLQFRFPDTRY